MVSKREKRGKPQGPAASGTGGNEDTAAPDIQPTAGAADDGHDPVSLQPSDKPPETAKEEASATGGQGAGVEAQPESGASESVAADPDADADAARPEAPEAKDGEGQEMTETSRKGGGASRGGNGKAPDGAAPQEGAGAGEQPNGGDGVVGEASGDATTPSDEQVPAKTTHGSATVVPDDAEPRPEELRPQLQGAPSAAPRAPGGDGMDVAEEEPTLVRVDRTSAVGRDDSSDEEDEDDGFRVVVGREVAPASTPVVPTKRFLRGTNTLVNTSTSSSTSAIGAKESTTGSKPVSAAAGIASLVPSKGAPVATARPSLKPGEYPPTAELQQSAGKTAFDVDIDGMEEQPWRHPGVDIADFFNYGFTEDSWRVYCEKQLRNRYDRTRGRSKATPAAGGRGSTSINSSSSINSSNGNSLMRHGGGDRPARMENSLQPQRPPQAQMHSNNGPPGPNSFRPQGPAGNMGAWAGGGGVGGGGPGRERFPHGFGPGPPPGHGSASPPWFDGQPQQQRMHQMRPQNRQHQQHFAPGPPGLPGGGGGGGGGMMGPGGGGMNNNGRGVDTPAGLRRSRSPDPRGGPLENKMARIR